MLMNLERQSSTAYPMMTKISNDDQGITYLKQMQMINLKR